MRAGLLRTKVEFRRKVTVASRSSDTGTSSWQALFSRRAHVRMDRGRERVEAGRLEAREAGVVTIRSDSETQGLTAADIAVFDGSEHQIRSIINPDNRGIMLEITVERGAVV